MKSVLMTICEGQTVLDKTVELNQEGVQSDKLSKEGIVK